jgi:ribonuclease-3 family protein
MQQPCNPNTLSPMALAFVGDAVYGLLVRRFLVTQANRPAGELHRRSVEMVNANAQSAASDKIMAMLSEKELAVFRRGRNVHTAHTPKNSTERDYHAATGLEALFGYLYLMGEIDRMNELFDVILGTDQGQTNQNA